LGCIFLTEAPYEPKGSSQIFRLFGTRLSRLAAFLRKTGFVVEPFFAKFDLFWD
jgi:hypothetical protein